MPRLFPAFLLACLLALPLASCDSTEPAPLVEETTFVPELEVDLAAMTRTDAGLYYRDLTEGTGAVVTRGHTALVYYTGWLPSGQQFDSRETGDVPFAFRIGAGEVIRGWDLGVDGMRVGGVRQLVVPPHLGYGSLPRAGIPANSILVFRVHVLSFQ